MIRRGVSGLVNRVEGLTGLDLDRDGDVGQHEGVEEVPVAKPAALARVDQIPRHPLHSAEVGRLLGRVDHASEGVLGLRFQCRDDGMGHGATEMARPSPNCKNRYAGSLNNNYSEPRNGKYLNYISSGGKIYKETFHDRVDAFLKYNDLSI